MVGTVRINMPELGKGLGVPEATILSPYPKPHEITWPQWDAALIRRAIDHLSSLKRAGNTVIFGGPAEDWVVVPLMHALLPECRLLYSAPDPKKTMPGRPPVCFDLELTALPLGTPPADGPLRFRLRREDDRVFLDYALDAPAARAHTFDDRLIPTLVLPELPADCHLFLHAAGTLCAQIMVTHSYSRHVKSVSTACRDAEVYHCAFSRCPEFTVGQQTPRQRTEVPKP